MRDLVPACTTGTFHKALVANTPVAALRRARSAARARFPTAMITIALPLGLRQIVMVGGETPARRRWGGARGC